MSGVGSLGYQSRETGHLPTTIVMKMVCLLMKVLKCLQVTEDVDIGFLTLATINQSIMEFIIVVIKVVTMLEILYRYQ